METSWSESPGMGSVVPQHTSPQREVVGVELAVEPVLAEAPAAAATPERLTEPETVRVTAAAAIEIASERSRTDPVPSPQPEATPRDEEMRNYPAPQLAQSYQLPSDLIQVETSPEKVEQIADNQATAPGERLSERPRRPRPPDEPASSEPLVQVETRH